MNILYLVDEVLEEFEVNSEEELLNKYGTKDFYEKAKEGALDYATLVCLDYLEMEDVIETIGIEKALDKGVISKEEAEKYKDMVKKYPYDKGRNLEELYGELL